MASRNSVQVFRGDDWEFSLFVTQTTDEGITSPYDPTGATLEATVGDTPVTPTIVDATTGKLSVIVPRAYTGSFDVGKHTADVQSTKDGIRTTIKKFQVEVLEDVTVP